jgi:chorismate lyase/3-hydroxybenzoate synthase
MRSSVTVIPTAIVRRATDAQQAPPLAAWLEDLFASAEVAGVHGKMIEPIEIRQRDGLVLISVRVPGATSLSVERLEDETFRAYTAIARDLEARQWHAVRFWNHVPHINELMEDGRDRYMVFNAGRYRAFCDWYGGPSQFDRHVATATGVGHHGRDLIVHCLAMARPGAAVENPRQVAPYHYSKRFGPLPPAFARATVLNASEDLPARILVGGTASVRGEDSVHRDDLEQQLDETFVNLAALVSAATHRINGNGKSNGNGDALSRYRELRAYVPDEANFDRVISAIGRACPTLARLEVLRADLCRPELLVEIEGIAD